MFRQRSIHLLLLGFTLVGNLFLEGGACRELRYRRRLDLHLLAGLWVPALARCTRGRLEGAKTYQSHRIAFGDSAHNLFDQHVQGTASGSLGKFGLGRQRFD